MGYPTYLAIDAGTTAVKLLLTDSCKHAVFRSERPVMVIRGEDGSAEIDTTAVWQAVCSLCRDGAEAVPEPWSRIAGLCITGQGDGLWAIDKQGQDLPRAICWQDLRAAALCEAPELVELARVHHSNTLWSGARAAILAWLKGHDPDLYDRIGCPLQCVGWLNYHFTGVCATDPSNCGDAFDIFAGQHLPAFYTQLGIDDLFSALPPVLPARAVIGTVTEKAAAETAVPAGTPVLNGCVDATAVTLGSPIPPEGTAQVCIGTTLLVMQISSAPPVFPLPEGAYADILPTAEPLYRMTLAAASGACAIDHEKNRLFPDLTYEQLYELLDQEAIGCGGLIYLPYLYGERAPFRCAGAKAGYHYETAGHTALQHMRASVEGVLFAARHCADASGLPLFRVELSGGASRSPILCSMVADVFGLPVAVGSRDQAGTAGCLELLGLPADTEQTPQIVFEPDMNRHGAYQEAYERYLKTSLTMRERWDTEAGKESLWISN